MKKQSHSSLAIAINIRKDNAVGDKVCQQQRIESAARQMREKFPEAWTVEYMKASGGFTKMLEATLGAAPEHHANSVGVATNPVFYIHQWLMDHAGDIRNCAVRMASTNTPAPVTETPNLDVPIANVTQKFAYTVLTAFAIKDDRKVLVHINSGFHRGTDGSIGCGSSVYPADHPECRWADYYPVIGTCFGLDVTSYVNMGVRFEALTGEKIFECQTCDADVIRDAVATLHDCDKHKAAGALYELVRHWEK